MAPKKKARKKRKENVEEGGVKRKATHQVTTVKFAGAKKAGTYDQAEADKVYNELRDRYHAESSAYHATARLWDDGIIEPERTRDILGMGLSTAANAPVDPTTFGVFRF